jgi:hypothetical protein
VLRPEPPRRRLHTDGLMVSIGLVAAVAFTVGLFIGRWL